MACILVSIFFQALDPQKRKYSKSIVNLCSTCYPIRYRSLRVSLKLLQKKNVSRFFLRRHNTTFSCLLLSFFWKWHNAADRTTASEFYFCLQISVLFSVRQHARASHQRTGFTSFFLALFFHYFFFLQAHNTYFRRDDAIDLIKKSRRRVNVIGNRWSRLRGTLEKLYASRSRSLSLFFFILDVIFFLVIFLAFVRRTSEPRSRRYIV